MEKKCIVCGKELGSRQLKYCSNKCKGLDKQGYKKCVVCGKEFKESASSLRVCCSAECSRINRQIMGKSSDTSKMIKKAAAISKEIGPEKHWNSRHWVIQSPDGKVYEINNLMNFIRENPSLFDGTPKQAFDGFQKIRATMEGKRPKAKAKSWKGWHLISYSKNDDAYTGK